jgi:hypothetical protein
MSWVGHCLAWAWADFDLGWTQYGLDWENIGLCMAGLNAGLAWELAGHKL